ncbi:DoxX-like family protein [Paenibacillus harenae]|uniref:DoxX-like family protein n=1 Tax=Paenibacillus harenae TaxID=306543 RepID=UPI0004143CBD|nr:DoxX-like family protein [Paenibacillus harenae]
MKNKPVYVELDINASLEELWERTQTPELHEQWDLRFSEIQYLPKPAEAERQKFLYRTRIGFGLRIEGTGETGSETDEKSGERLSTLAFASEQKVSLIRQGGGYWQYKPQGRHVTFSTLFDYSTRFGIAGQLLDRWLFRPMFGYATAWSFDRLRIWLEERIPPSVTAERALIHYGCVFLLCALWCYEGIVPKLLFPEWGELTFMSQTGWFDGAERQAVQLLGIGEIGFGLITAFLHRRRWTALAQIAVLLSVTLPAMIYNPELFRSPFNPLTLMLPMIALCLAANGTKRHLPDARRCSRRLSRARTTRRRSDEIHL